MSAPQTNLEKQEKRHWGPIAGITLALIVAVAAAVYFIGADEVENDAVDPDGTPDAVIEQADDMDATVDSIETDREIDEAMDEAEEADN